MPKKESRWVITGATGFIGKHLVNLVRKKHRRARILGTGLEDGSHLDEHIPRFQDLEEVNGSDILVHLAANTDPQDQNAEAVNKVNHLEGADLIHRAWKAGCRKIVVASSAAVYGKQSPRYLVDPHHYRPGRRPLFPPKLISPSPFTEEDKVDPLTPYARSKLALEWQARGYLFEWDATRAWDYPILWCLRFSNVYGPGEEHKGKAASVLSQVVRQMKAGERPRLFQDGNQRRDWVEVLDVAEAIYRATQSETQSPRNIVNVGSGTATSFRELVGTVNGLLGTRLEPEWIPNPYQSTYQDWTCLDVGKAERELGWKPTTTLEDGIAKLAQI